MSVPVPTGLDFRWDTGPSTAELPRSCLFRIPAHPSRWEVTDVMLVGLGRWHGQGRGEGRLAMAGDDKPLMGSTSAGLYLPAHVHLHFY